MAISNFKLPTGLEVSGTTTITGSVGVSQTLTAVNLTASGDISGSVGNYGSLFVNGSAVLTSVGLTGYAKSADVSSSFVQPSQVSASYTTPAQVSASFAQPADVSASFSAPSQVSASFVQPAQVSASYSTPAQISASFVQPSQVSSSYTTPSQITGAVAFLTASNVFTTDQTITGALNVSSNVTIGGNLTVKGTTTSIDSTTVNVGDLNLNLGTGSNTLAALDGGGLDLGTTANVQLRYDNTNTAWSSNVDLNVASTKVYKVAGTTALGGGSLGAVSGIYVTSGSLISPTNPGKLTITSNGSSSLSASAEINLTAPKVFVGSALVTTASLNANTSVSVGNVSTTTTAINGATTNIYGTNLFLTGTNAVYVSGTQTQITGNVYFNSAISGTTAQFTIVTGSAVTGTLATFTTVSASAMSASTILVNSIAPNFRYENSNSSLSINTLQTGTIDTFAWATYGGAKYTIKAKEQAGTNYCHVAELIVATDGTYAFGTPYGSTYTSPSAIMGFEVALNGANVDVKIINNSAQTVVVKWIKDYLTA